MKNIPKIVVSFLAIFLLVGQNMLVFALDPSQLQLFQDNINYFDSCGGTSLDTNTPSTGTVGGSGGTIATSTNTPPGQALGGVADTGFTQAEIDQAKARSSGTSFSGASNFLATTYGPPWSAQEGSGVTSTGVSLAGPDNSHGRPRYEIAVDPNVIPYGSLVTVWPNALNWHGAFLAADTGGAIIGNHVDVYDWTGDGTKNSFSANGAKVEPYTGNLAGVSTDNSATQTNSCCSNGSGSAPTSAAAPAATSGSVWNSGLQPPYIIEQFAIELLKDIASKTGVPASSTVTKEHVTALVTFAIAEGGDIQNQDLFNLYNSGWPDPQFLASGHSVTGVQSFKSFDAGVEATSRHMTTGVQERLGGILSQPNSTAEDFFKTLVDTAPYKGVAQSSWADPNPPLSYYLGALAPVKANYKDYASIEIGTPAHEQADGTRDPSKLDPSLAGGTGGPSTAGSSGQCGGQCAQAAGATGNTIVIDPGHGPSRTVKDSATGLNMVEQPGGAGDEIGHVWNVANIMKKDLEVVGYRVLLTKKDINDTVTFRDRVNTADQNNAVLALSIHGDETLGNPGEIYTQKVGLYRGQGSNKTTFSDASIADKSLQYAKIFQQERQKISGQSVVIKDDTFTSRGIGMEPGNIPMVQLLSKTPWVYNEKHMPFDDNEYAKELEESVKQAVPLNGGATPAAAPATASTGCAASGSIQAAIDLAMKYAWPDGPHGPPQKPEYAAAIQKARSNGEYTGGGSPIGDDCGAFVTRVMRDSGADPNYNWGPKNPKEGNTVAQQAYMDANPQKYKNLGQVTNTKDLQPGDIAIVNSSVAEHTYIYVGPQSTHPSFNGDSASASIGTPSRSPNASNAYLTENGAAFTWYRLM